MDIEPFDEYVSLGNRCETAFQIQRVVGKGGLYPSFFNWNVTHLESLIILLTTRFDGVLQFDNLTPSPWLVHDSVGDYLFHLVGEGRESKDHPAFRMDLENHRKKIAHILDRYYCLATSGQQICYFYRTEDMSDMRPYAEKLRNLLENLHGNRKFVLVFIQVEEARRPDWDDGNVFNRYVKRLSPDDDQGDSHILSWDRIFREFPRRGDMNLCYWM